jgi:hypothetical protein
MQQHDVEKQRGNSFYRIEPFVPKEMDMEEMGV